MIRLSCGGKRVKTYSVVNLESDVKLSVAFLFLFSVVSLTNYLFQCNLSLRIIAEHAKRTKGIQILQSPGRPCLLLSQIC